MSFQFEKTLPEAVTPFKARDSDSGYDLHLVKHLKTVDGVEYYDTGIKLLPDKNHYFEIVGRSSISKTGYMLANNIGIIDNEYTGNIIVALIKVNKDMPSLTLPYKLVQAIPRKLVTLDMYEVGNSEKIAFTEQKKREDSGGLGSAQFKN